MPEGSRLTEQLFHEWSAVPRLSQRVVASGAWDYLVDLALMTQTNVKHSANTRRQIRRWTPALGDDQTPPGRLPRARLVFSGNLFLFSYAILFKQHGTI